MSEPIRAEHLGSFLRPPGLLEAIGRFEADEITEEALTEAQDAAILEILRVQEETGVDVFSDGEYRRHWFAGAWTSAIGGLVDAPASEPIGIEWHGPNVALAEAAFAAEETQVVGAHVFATHRLAEREQAFLARHSSAPFKITLPGVTQQALHWFCPGITDAYYASQRELIDAMAAILAAETGALVRDGVKYVQLDSLYYVTQYTDDGLRAKIVEAGLDPEQVLADSISADNASLAPAVESPEVTAALHMCRGNNRGAWSATGGYDRVAEQAFNELHVDRLLLEYDTERAGGFEPLRFVPADKTVVLGLVSTKVAQLESEDDLLRRIEEASRYVPIERLALSPQCGFASVLEGNPITWEDQRRKLELVASTARRVWG
jgi:5-methyltetrahydropteroyltriglutamate--homocysteine methyltransferase